MANLIDVSVFVTSPSTIYLATQADHENQPDHPLYVNANAEDQEGPQRPRRRKQRTTDTEESSGQDQNQSQVVCRSVSFLQKRSYQECFNSAIESQVQKLMETTGFNGGAPESAATAQSSDGGGFEWEFQDLSLYLGSFKDFNFTRSLQIDSTLNVDGNKVVFQ